MLKPLGVETSSIKQMYINSTLTKKLNEDLKTRREEFRRRGTSFVNIWGKLDLFAPYPHSKLEDPDKEYDLNNHGHVSIVNSEETAKILEYEVKETWEKTGKPCPVVLLHGFCLNEKTFNRLLGRLKINCNDIATKTYTVNYDYTKEIISV